MRLGRFYIRWFFALKDMYMGVYWSKDSRTAYCVFPPCCVLAIRWLPKHMPTPDDVRGILKPEWTEKPKGW